MPSTFENRPDTTDWSMSTFNKDCAEKGVYYQWFMALSDEKYWEEEGNNIKRTLSHRAELTEVLKANNNKIVTVRKPEVEMTGELIASTQIRESYSVYAADDSLGFWLHEARIQRDESDKLTIIVD